MHSLFTPKVWLQLYIWIFNCNALSYLKEEITEIPYDLPREISAMKVLMENFKPNDEIIKFKDMITWKLIEHQRSVIEIKN